MQETEKIRYNRRKKTTESLNVNSPKVQQNLLHAKLTNTLRRTPTLTNKLKKHRIRVLYTQLYNTRIRKRSL